MALQETAVLSRLLPSRQGCSGALVSRRRWCPGDSCAPGDAVEPWRRLVRGSAVQEAGLLQERWRPGDCDGPAGVQSTGQCAQETGALGVCPPVRRARGGCPSPRLAGTAGALVHLLVSSPSPRLCPPSPLLPTPSSLCPPLPLLLLTPSSSPPSSVLLPTPPANPPPVFALPHSFPLLPWLYPSPCRMPALASLLLSACWP